MNQIDRSARIVVVACLLVTGFGITPTARAAPLARAEPPPPSDNVTVVHEGLNYPRGLIFDADGNLYVVEAGRGGDTEVTAATCPDFTSPFMPYHVGMSGRVVKITPAGEESTVVEGLPSARDPFDWVIGPNAVTVLDGELYVLQGAGGCSRALDDIPNGIVRANADGTWETVVDLSAFWRAQWDPANLADDDIEPDGEAYGLIAEDGMFYVVETNQGALLQASVDGNIERLVDFQADYGAIAPSVVAAHNGDLYVGNIGDFPTEAGAAKVFKVAMDGAVEVYAEGLTNILGLEFDDAGNLYVLQMSDGSAELPGPGMGNIVRIDTEGAQAVIASGLTAPAGLTWGPDGALYVSLFGYDMEPGLPSADMGQIVRVDVAAAEDSHTTDIEQLKAEAIEQELGAFDLYINRDWETLDAVTGADYYGVGVDGSYTERAAMLAGLQDEKLTVLPPDLGEIRVLMITPEAYMVTYPLNFNGIYDGNAFSNPRTVSSLWVKRDGKWQNIFLAEEERAGPLHTTANMPATVMLPNGFEPEGITIGRDATAYVTSLSSGAIYKVNLATGEGDIFVPGQAPATAVGMTYDRRTDLLYVAGHESGNGLVYNGLTGEPVAKVQFTTGANSLINDVAVADDAVFFTDSYLPVVYRLPLDPESHLPDPTASETIALTGDFETLPDGLNSNGIVASPDGATLIIAHTDLGKLYRVDAASGEAAELALDSELQPYHDGLVLDSNTLYVVNGTQGHDQVYVIELDPDWMSGKLVDTITDPNLEGHSTAAIYADVLYVVNARWDAERTPETEYWLTQIKR